MPHTKSQSAGLNLAGKGAVLSFLKTAVRQIGNCPLKKPATIHTVAFPHSHEGLHCPSLPFWEEHTLTQVALDALFLSPPLSSTSQLRPEPAGVLRALSPAPLLGAWQPPKRSPTPAPRSAAPDQERSPSLTAPSRPRRMLLLLMSLWITWLA